VTRWPSVVSKILLPGSFLLATALVAYAASADARPAATTSGSQMPASATATRSPEPLVSAAPTEPPTVSLPIVVKSSPIASTTVAPVQADPGQIALPATPVFRVSQGTLFTFDDCEARPGQGTTANYLGVLKKHHILRAIFFLTGNCYTTRPDMVRMIRDGGYTIGNHTRTHADLTRLSVSAIDEQIEGGPASTVFRPPYGAHNAIVDARVAAHHLQTMMWSSSGGDSGGGVARTCDRILEDLVHTVKPGSIVLLHLFNSNSPAALDAYLSGRQDCERPARSGR
jgi:hypothetical protein